MKLLHLEMLEAHDSPQRWKPCAVEAELVNAALRFGKRLFDLKSTDTRHTVAGGALLKIGNLSHSTSEHPMI